MMQSSRTSRRRFLQIAAAGAVAGTNPRVAAAAEPRRGGRQPSANDRIQVGLIGAGGQGQGDTRTALRVPGVELVAASDVYDGRLRRVKELFGAGVFTTRDYREVLARPEIDAVVVATPDHWHMRIALEAMQAGKDVYLEKPMVQHVGQGHELVAAQRVTKRILQVGSQRVSSILYDKARRVMAEGAIGELNLIEAWWDRNSAIGAWQYTIPPDASPRTVDWDRFLGGAPRRPFDATRMFRWRNYRDYGTGVAGDLFVHLFSGMHHIVGAIGPTRVFATGGLRLWTDGRDVPDVMLGLYDYPRTDAHPAFTLVLRVNFADGSGGGSGFRFVGSEGIMTVGRTVTVTRKPRRQAPGYTIATFPTAMQEQFLRDYRTRYPDADRKLTPAHQETYTAPSGYSDSFDHFRNFFQAVRHREPVVEDATFGLRAAGPALLSNQSYFESKAIAWDPERMQVGA